MKTRKMNRDRAGSTTVVMKKFLFNHEECTHGPWHDWNLPWHDWNLPAQLELDERIDAGDLQEPEHDRRRVLDDRLDACRKRSAGVGDEPR